MLIGMDDTDSPLGGCTTHFALEAAAAFARAGFVLRSLPRLVRLNPNVPWKTRGNAAVALDVGSGRKGQGSAVGEAADGTAVLFDPGAAPVAAVKAHLDTLLDLVGRWCDLKQPGTDPAVVLANAPLPASLYWDAVRGVVDPADVRNALGELSPPPLWSALGDGRGIVGASAALAYPPDRPTFELIAYRKQDRWGTKRAVDFASVDRMDRAFPRTYNNVDRANKHVAIAPSTPCPLLFGVRATELEGLRRAAEAVDAGEPWGGSLLFETNQGTDAHVVEATTASALALSTVRIAGRVGRAPRRLPGGHLVFPLEDGLGEPLDCAAYEPTKEFRDLVASLERGDRIQAVGAVRSDRRTLNLEKLEVVEPAPRPARSVGPLCARCGKRMKSSGRAGPYRCRGCGAKQPRGDGPPSDLERGPARGWYEVPICARRHLAKPIDPHGYGPSGAGDRLQAND